MPETEEETKLNYIDFYKKLYHPELKKRIVVTPLLKEEQIGHGIVDLRLGTEFILTKKTRFSNLNVINYDLPHNIKKYQERVIINLKDNLVLHPHQFILGSTLEYIKLPDDIMGYIIGRSSWGRLGLIIATATLIHPKFAGVITLELTNVGEVPINLYPGLRIAQLTLHKCKLKNLNKSDEKGKYFGSTSPNFSRIYEDSDICLVITKKKERNNKSP